MTLCDCGCGSIVPDKRVARSKHHKIFLNDQHRIEWHKADDKARRLAIWEAAPPSVCEECQRLFKPTFQAGWPRRKRCPECMLSPAEHNRRRRADVKQGGPKHSRKPRRWEVIEGQATDKPRYCQRCKKLITNGNWMHCPECKAWYFNKEDAWMEDYQAVETIRLSDMGLIPY